MICGLLRISISSRNRSRGYDAGGLEHAVAAHVEIALVCAGADQIHFADRIASLLDVLDLHVTVGKRADPTVHQIQVAVAPLSDVAKRVVFEDTVHGEQFGAFSKASLVEALVVFANEKVAERLSRQKHRVSRHTPFHDLDRRLSGISRWPPLCFVTAVIAAWSVLLVASTWRGLLAQPSMLGSLLLLSVGVHSIKVKLPVGRS